MPQNVLFTSRKALPDSMQKILLFIPCYNCSAQIGRVLAQITPEIASWLAEILIVDNGSSDGTPEAAITAARNAHLPVPVSVVRNKDNYNLGGSHKSAFRYARKNGLTHVLVMHGDNQGQIADILPVLKAGQHLQYDACLGARFMRGSRLRGYSRFRTFGNHVFNLIFSVVTKRWIYDLGSGLNIFAASVFTDDETDYYADDLRFNIFLLLGFIYKKRRILFFPILWSEDDQVSNVKMFSQAMKTLAIARDYLLRPEWFATTDHRSVSHTDYQFDTLARIVDGSVA